MNPTTQSCITEAEVNRCFLETLYIYVEQLPPKQATTVRRSVDILLVPRAQLSSQDYVRLINLLWEHRGTPLEVGYRLKEDLVRWLRCENTHEQRARAKTLCCTWEEQVMPPFYPLLQTLKQYAQNSHVPQRRQAYTLALAVQ